jgi:hypothetical protein
MVGAAAVVSVGLVLGTGLGANALTPGVTATASSSMEAAHPVSVTFALFAPNAPVVFAVNGAVVGTGVTNSNGDVSFTFMPEGLAPGYYRLVASTSYGISSSIGFGVE